ncbi:sulfotransferase family protein [Novosphingobium sp. 1949]|uniref:Sulfotransferase family protein n=1 Tax=Novosphingobium organovorum TaxID=2930092 RepID=A0ABT0BEP8_9SPHN|nr:sulfotransferase family protein [Novosphingobium organovorum]MCJ2183522.1 sulfotransferase family protein [Novosphingobium organovorum]
MLYVEDANLAFIHIPKNAGQSVRRALGACAPLSFAAMARDLGVDEARAEQMMEEPIETLPGLGVVQPEHVPLAFLQHAFPHSFAQLRAARSFIMVRDPRDRFFSALLQRMREYGGATALRADDPAVAEEARAICRWLDGRGPFCDMPYIHFSRQVDYAEIAGERIVSALFPLERSDALTAWARATCGIELDITHDHARREPKAWASALQPGFRFVGRTLLPSALKKAIYPLWMNSAVFANAANRYGRIHLDAETEAFIADYYAPDAALYAEAQRFAEAVRPGGHAAPARKAG